MRIGLVCLGLGLGFGVGVGNVFAAETEKLRVEMFPTEMTYMLEKSRREVGEVERSRLSAWAKRKGLSANFAKNLPVDGSIVDANLEKWILISSNRRVNPGYLGRVFAHRGNRLIHVEVAGRQLALYMIGHSEDDALALAKYLMSEHLDARQGDTAGATRMPASEVVGSGPGDGGSRAGASSGSGGDRSAADYAYALGDVFGSCAVGVKEGVEGVLIAPFTMAGASLKSLAKNPSAWWDRSVKEMEEVAHTVRNFKEFAAKKWTDFKSKSEAEKSQLYCSFVGGPAALGAVGKVAKVGAAARVQASSEVSVAGRAAPGVFTDAAYMAMIDDVLAGLRSGSQASIEKALQKIKGLKELSFSSEFGNSVGVGTVNTKIISVSDELAEIFSSSKFSEALSVQAAEAYVHYGRVASRGWQYGYIGRHMVEDVPHFYRDFKLPDSVRRVLFVANQEQRAVFGFGPLEVFETSAALKAKETIGFLGKTRSELSGFQASYAWTIQKHFANLPEATQRSVFASMESGKGIPVAFHKQYLSTADVSNKNALTHALREAGFVKTQSQRGHLLTYTHPETKSQIILSSDSRMPIGTTIRVYTDAEVARIRAAMQTPGGRYTITNATE